MAEIFINYRTSDEAYAAMLLDEKLCERFGPDRVFRDNRSIDVGVDFRPELWGSLARSAVFIVVVGQDWLRADKQGRRRIDDPDDFVRREIVWALRIGIRVLPVLVGEVPALRTEDLPQEIAELAHRQYRRLSTRGARQEISQLVDEVSQILHGPPAKATGAGAAVAGDPGDQVPLGRPGTAAMVAIEDDDGGVPAAAPPARLAALRAVIHDAAADVGLPAAEITDRDNGVGLFAPLSVAPIQLAAGFAERLDATLAARQSGEKALRVRMGLCEAGTGHSGRNQFARATELVCLPALDNVLRSARRAHLVLVLPDEFFDRIVRSRPHLIDPSTFLCLLAGPGGGYCWVHVPGYPAPPGLPPEPAGTGPAPTGQHAANQADVVVENQGTAFINRGPMYGDQFGGDLVMGHKNSYGAEVRRT